MHGVISLPDAMSYDKCSLSKRMVGVFSKGSDQNGQMPVRLEPAAPWSRIKHSTTALPSSNIFDLKV